MSDVLTSDYERGFAMGIWYVLAQMNRPAPEPEPTMVPVASPPDTGKQDSERLRPIGELLSPARGKLEAGFRDMILNVRRQTEEDIVRMDEQVMTSVYVHRAGRRELQGADPWRKRNG